MDPRLTSWIANVAAVITKARKAYYAGTPTMTDAEFDALEDNLRAVAPNHPVLANVGALTTARDVDPLTGMIVQTAVPVEVDPAPT